MENNLNSFDSSPQQSNGARKNKLIKNRRENLADQGSNFQTNTNAFLKEQVNRRHILKS